jgi:hypothetical protein
MQKLLMIFLLFSFASTCFGQTNEQKSCIAKWKYRQSVIPIHGVLIHFGPVADCGYFITASLSIVKTDRGDTIRVLQLCDTTKKVIVQIKVTLLPTSRVKKKASLIPSDPWTDCKIKKTYYGRLVRD